MGTLIIIFSLILILLVIAIDDIRKGDQTMPYLPEKVYEWLRWIVCIVIPAAMMCFGIIATALGFQYTELVLTIAGAVNTFLGTIFGISKINYDRAQKLKGK